MASPVDPAPSTGMHGLSQWDALAFLVDVDETFAELLDVPATWWVDEAGVAHGRADHVPAGTPPQSGTLRDLTGAARHTKGCASVTRVAGPTGAAAAATAQQLTEGLAGMAGLQQLADTHPYAAVSEAARLHARLAVPETDVDAGMAAVLARAREQVRRIGDAAFIAAQSPSTRQALLDRAVDVIVERDPASPVTQLRDQLRIAHRFTPTVAMHTVTFGRSELPATPLTARLPDLRAAIDEAHVQFLGVADLVDPAVVLSLLGQGRPLRDAIVDTWRTQVHALVEQIPAWAAQVRVTAATDPRIAVLVCPPDRLQRTHEAVAVAWAASATDRDTGVLAVPAPVAAAVCLLDSSAGYAIADPPLTAAELHTAGVLAADAAWQVPDVAGLLVTARALAL